MEIEKELEKVYGLTKTEAAKAEMLLLWFLSVSPHRKSIPWEEFDRRYKWLFREQALFYSWGPFYRDHGQVGLRSGRL